ncbi:MAG: type III polyketide synthase [Alphaproteobacteria bacterium]
MASLPAARFLALSTASPPHVIEQGDVMAAAGALFGKAYPDLERLLPVYLNAAVGTRRSCVPLAWYLEPHSFAERNRLYMSHALDLLSEATERCLATAGQPLDAIDALVMVSTSGIATPSLDALLMERLELRRDVVRLPIFGLGCAGGVLGLARAAQLAQALPGKRVLLLVVELCGLTFRSSDMSKSNLIATALFGDGAAAALVSTEGGGPSIAATGEHSFPGTLDVMGWRIEDDGFGVQFSRDIPALIRSRLRPVLDAFLAKAGYAFESIEEFICHPGGAKVLDAMEEILGLQQGEMRAARQVLREHGNMSAASVLFVLDAARRGLAGDRPRRLLTSLGPGFTAGFLVLEPP